MKILYIEEFLNLYFRGGQKQKRERERERSRKLVEIGVIVRATGSFSTLAELITAQQNLPS